MRSKQQIRESIENSILASILFVNDSGNDIENVFKLDSSVFTSKYRQRVAEQINNVTDGFYGYLMTQIEEKCIGTSYEQDYIDIISQSPMSLQMAQKYYDDLVVNKRMEELV